MACCDVEPYIREALDSVMKQSFADWECLCGIEDSKDKTEDILREIAAAEPRIRIFTHPRSGSCSATRNIGIDMAQGEYVIFLDGDDTIAEESLARIHDKIAARPGADIYPCVIIACHEGMDKREIRENFPPGSSPEELTGPEAIILLDRLGPDRFCPMLQICVFRREFLVEHGLKCIYGLRRQDSEFSPRAIYLAKRIVPLHEPFYLYRIRGNSVSSAKGAGYFHKDWAVINKSLFAFHAKVSREPGFDRRISECWARLWLPRFLYFWFDPWNIRSIPREQRLETLGIVFSDGFGDFNLLLRFADVHRRVAGWCVRIFVRRSALRWMVERFFLLYYGLSDMKNRKCVVRTENSACGGDRA